MYAESEGAVAFYNWLEGGFTAQLSPQRCILSFSKDSRKLWGECENMYLIG